MKEITLNGKFMASESSAQEYLFDVFDFPEYYGNDLEGFYDALTEGGAEAVLAASLFHYKELQIRELKEYLCDKGVSVRL